MTPLLILIGGLSAPPFSGAGDRQPQSSRSADAAVRRGMAFLSREVPRWQREHACFSCHNNGDGARALYRLRAAGDDVPDAALSGTTAWLAQPQRWKDNHGDERFSDKTLANIQFAAALTAAYAAGAIEDRQPLVSAAELLVRDQQPDGTWKIDAPGAIGSPITYGPFLTAAVCRDVLVHAGQQRFQQPLERVDRFLRREPPRTVLDAAGCLLGLGSAGDDEALRQRGACLEIIRAAAAEDGGWGPYRNAPLEPFDTAVAVLALSRLPERGQPDDLARLTGGGRAYLIRTQLADGGWPETTRPAGRESYAHRVSTTAWAVQALSPGIRFSKSD